MLLTISLRIKKSHFYTLSSKRAWKNKKNKWFKLFDILASEGEKEKIMKKI